MAIVTPKDVPDWTPQVSTIRRRLYPEGVATPVTPDPAFTLAAAANVTKRFAMPGDAVSLCLGVTAGGLLFGYDLLVLGVQSGLQYYGDPGAPGSRAPVPSPTLPFNVGFFRDFDNELDVQMGNTGANLVSVFCEARASVEPLGQVGAATAVVETSPAPWQSPFSFVAVNVSIASAGTATLLAAPPGASRTYCHGWSLGQDGANAVGRLQQLLGGVVAVECDVNATRQMNLWGDHKGLPTVGAVTLSNQGAAASFVAASLAYRQAS